MTQNVLLALEDGSLFYGSSIGAEGESTGEVVFNTALTGYQEILTDPSYYQQIVTLTHPHIGNTGTNPEDEESPAPAVSGLVIRDLPLLTSNWRSTESLSEYLQRHNVVAIADIDTRKLTRLLREKGALKGCLISGKNINEKLAIEKANAFPGLVGMDLAKEVTTKETYKWTERTWDVKHGYQKSSVETLYKVIAYDYGVKRNILRILVDLGCDLTVVPA
ncbi:MAG: carbamoyl-phosphate synthase domain-containing protein, partial [Pseudomonadota bacterium]